MFAEVPPISPDDPIYWQGPQVTFDFAGAVPQGDSIEPSAVVRAFKVLLVKSGYEPDAKRFAWLTAMGVAHMVSLPGNLDDYEGGPLRCSIVLRGVDVATAKRVGASVGERLNLPSVGLFFPHDWAEGDLA